MFEYLLLASGAFFSTAFTIYYSFKFNTLYHDYLFIKQHGKPEDWYQTGIPKNEV